MGSRIFGRAGRRSWLSSLTTVLPGLVGAACSANQGEQSGESREERAALECQGACPVYVDPGVVQEGDGSSWESPLRSVQAAIDAQAARGGGEVWVRAGGPFDALSGDANATLIQLRSGVGVFGGFAGTEDSPEERDSAARTVVAGSAWGEDGDAAALVTGAPNTTLDGVSIVGHHGPALVFRNATDVRVTNVSIEASSLEEGALIDVSDSEARFEGLRVSDSNGLRAVPGLLATRSTVRLTGSEFIRLQIQVDGASAAVAASSSRLLLDRVRFVDNEGNTLGKASGLAITDSDVLVADSVWLNNGGDRGVLVATGSRLVAVNSHWERNGAIGGIVRLLQGTNATFLNAAFVSNGTQYYGTVDGQNSELELVNATFVDNRCSYPRHSYPDDVSFSGTGQVALHNSYSNRGQYSIYQPFTGSGNCLLEGPEPYREVTGAGLTKVLLRPEFGCLDSGDDGAARAATERVSLFADSLGATIPLAAGWWLSSSAALHVPSDNGPIDPGRHYGADE